MCALGKPASLWFAAAGLLAPIFGAVVEATPKTPIQWLPKWNDSVFAEAARQHKFVLLDLHAVWCHWCHVMDDTTYADPAVQVEIRGHYIAVSVDADSDPGLTSRYGDWGWPATIVLASDGTEIVKRRGYIPPAHMLSLLRAIIADPRPGPSVVPAQVIASGGGVRLTDGDRDTLNRAFDVLYDPVHAGWGTEHKYLDAAAIEWSFAKLDRGDKQALQRIRSTLNANLNLIDPVWGGVYQYSDETNWQSPHFEKLLSFQADDLRLYSEAYARLHSPSDLRAAENIFQYVARFLSAPDGAFYVSQDADVSAQLTGHDFYAKEDRERRTLGMPRVDVHEYSLETGWAIRALCKYYDVTGNLRALQAAERGARWALQARAIRGGGYRHGANDQPGPFLDDNVSMTQGLVALYRSTGDREWLSDSIATLTFIDRTLRHPQAGYVSSPAVAADHGVFREPVRDVTRNADLVRVASMIHHYTGDERFLKIAEHAMRYLTSYATMNRQQFRPEILLADRELTEAPIHITVVGAKREPAAQALHAAALRYPADYLQVDWWDRVEGPLPNPNIAYPRLDRSAAFACTSNACSIPIFDPNEIVPRVRAMLEIR
jgi:uncharacterized protein YyaL (SSP411 family)